MSVGGSVESVSLDGRDFAVPADVDVDIMIGGKQNETQPNGNGTVRQIQRRVACGVSGLRVDVDDTRDDPTFLQNLADRPGYFDMTLTMASGSIYQGDVQIEGELTWNSGSTTAAITLKGQNKLTKQ